MLSLIPVAKEDRSKSLSHSERRAFLPYRVPPGGEAVGRHGLNLRRHLATTVGGGGADGRSDRGGHGEARGGQGAICSAGIPIQISF